MPSRKKTKSVVVKPASENASSLHPDDKYCFEGESLSSLLKSICNVIESEREANKVVPDKFWFKQRFAIGVNEVTRLLERMPPISSSAKEDNSTVNTPPSYLQRTRVAVPVNLQALLVASDSTPRWMTKHLPSLAASRGVPVIYINEKKEGSLRLGELVKIKTAITIGVKVKENNINKLFKEILRGEGKNSWMEMSAGLPPIVTESTALPLLTTLE